jgi:hypothetical protein
MWQHISTTPNDGVGDSPPECVLCLFVEVHDSEKESIGMKLTDLSKR